jgi:hypothetical protein
VLLVVICFPPFGCCKSIDIVIVSHFNGSYLCSCCESTCTYIYDFVVHAVKVLALISMASCKPLHTSTRTSQIFKFSSLEHNRGICKMLCESVQAFKFKCLHSVSHMGIGFLCLEKHDK